MLTDILKLLDEGRAYSQDDLARVTGSDRETVEAQIQHLAEMGYLKQVVLQKSCGGSCKGCSQPCEQPAAATMPVMWEK